MLAATRLIALHKNKGMTVAACLKNRTDYIENPDKTEQGQFVSSYACSALTADEEFMLTKRQYDLVNGRRQKSDVIAYQIRQSFRPGEITAEEANKVGYELAMRFTKGKYGELSAEERLALSELNCILSETPQWSSEEELCHDMENIGGRVRFCRFWNEHYSMVQLTEDRNGKYSTAYVLDTETTPDVRKVAALQAQKELADRMQAWGVSLLDTSVPEQMKYDFLAEAASHLMQVLNDPEHITG